MENLSKGYLFLTLGQLAVALNFIIGKFLSTEIPIFAFMGARFFVSSVIFAILNILSKSQLANQGETLEKKDWLIMATQAFSTGFLFNLLFFTGLEHTSATSAGVITSTLPGVIAVLSYFILKERINLTGLAGIGLSIIGVLIIAMDNEPNLSTTESFLGNAMIFLALVPEAYFSILCKMINKKVTLLGNALIVNTLSFLMVLPFMLSGLKEIEFSQLPLSNYVLLCLSGLTSVLFFMFWPRGLKIVPANIAGIFGGVLPIATGILATIFLGETFSWADACGMVCVLGALWLGAESNQALRSEPKEIASFEKINFQKD